MSNTEQAQTSQTRAKDVTSLTAFSIVVVGLSIGWLIGLSNSPVLATTLAVLVPIAGTATIVAGGMPVKLLEKYFENIPPRNLIPHLLALLAFGLAAGATLGMHYRIDLDQSRTRALALGPTATTRSKGAAGLFNQGSGSDYQISLPCVSIESLEDEVALRILRNEFTPWNEVAEIIGSQDQNSQRAMLALVRHLTKNCKE